MRSLTPRSCKYPSYLYFSPLETVQRWGKFIDIAFSPVTPRSTKTTQRTLSHFPLKKKKEKRKKEKEKRARERERERESESERHLPIYLQLGDHHGQGLNPVLCCHANLSVLI